MKYSSLSLIVTLLWGQISFSHAQPSSPGWHQWRGPHRNGIISSADWPKSLSDDSISMVWTRPLEASYSSPVFDEHAVYSTQTLDDDTEQALALDRRNGEILWSTSWKGGLKVPFFARANGSWIRSTPLLDQGRLYVMGMQETLVCLNAKTGELLWKMSVPNRLETPDPSFGGVSSPLMHDGAIYVQAAGGLIKVDATEGKLVWSAGVSSDSMNTSPFSSPMLMELHGKPQLVALERTRLCGLDLSSGEYLWSQEVPAFRGMNILTPTQVGNRLLTATYGGKTHLYEPSLSASGQWEVEETWQYKFQGYMSSPVVVGTHAYLHGRSGRLACLDLEAGDLTWTSEQSFGKYCSQVTNGQQMLCLSNDGWLHLIENNPAEYVSRGKVRLSEDETWAHLTVEAPHIMIRSLNAMSLYRWQASSQQGTGRAASSPKLPEENHSLDS